MNDANYGNGAENAGGDTSGVSGMGQETITGQMIAISAFCRRISRRSDEIRDYAAYYAKPPEKRPMGFTELPRDIEHMGALVDEMNSLVRQVDILLLAAKREMEGGVA